MIFRNNILKVTKNPPCAILDICINVNIHHVPKSARDIPLRLWPTDQWSVCCPLYNTKNIIVDEVL